ncbi:murein hydrolase activator EnvC family protein [Pseudoalteromonas sp. T1lg65]|uniref:murein hydrolase activator EnvC family protein n=1 Tax=Pseudoalteromonas sp. T1lg65 TaxID=2077101 RepID=UPI003F7A8125
MINALKIASILLVLATTSVVANESRTKEDLSAVQQEIKKSTQAYNQQRAEIKAMESKLRSFELDIAKSAKALSLTAKGIADNQQEQSELRRQSHQLASKKQTLEKLLAAQLKSAYMTGAHDYSRMLLNQEKAAKLERTISYYNYFNKARIRQLNELKLVSEQLNSTQQSLLLAQRRLEALKTQQTERHQQLQIARQERQAHLAALNEKLKSTQSAIAYLKENEQTLIATLEELSKVQSVDEIILAGLRNLKGKMPWPVQGRIKHRFGQRKHAGMNWKGVLIDASDGDGINSIAPGQVVFADWLNGFGWVIVLDHGDGYMSLYGHAQTLLRDVGDQVQSGETIALVGQSGGQRNPGLYFELRHKGSAVDPVKWCSSS